MEVKTVEEGVGYSEPVQVKTESEGRPPSFDLFLLNLHDNPGLALIGQENPTLVDRFQAWLEYTARYLTDREMQSADSTPVMPLVELAKRGAGILGKEYDDDFWNRASESQLKSLAESGYIDVFLVNQDPRQPPSPTRQASLSDSRLALLILESAGVINSGQLGDVTEENVWQFLREGGERFDLEFPNMPEGSISLKVNFDSAVPSLSFRISGKQALEFRRFSPTGFTELSTAMRENKRRSWPPGGLSWVQANR